MINMSKAKSFGKQAAYMGIAYGLLPPLAAWGLASQVPAVGLMAPWLKAHASGLAYGAAFMLAPHVMSGLSVALPVVGDSAWMLGSAALMSVSSQRALKNVAEDDSTEPDYVVLSQSAGA